MIIKRLSKIEYDYLHSLKDDNKVLSMEVIFLNQELERVKKERDETEKLLRSINRG